jgi:hypothetical protein
MSGRVVAAALSALVIAVIGGLGLAAGVPWLLPSLGPTIALQSASPDLPASRLRSVLVGHAVGLVSGFVAVYVTGAYADPAVTGGAALTAARVAAAVLAIALSMSGDALTGAQHPPAQATTLLVALGAVAPTLQGALTVAAGVVLVAALGEAVRRWRVSPG